LLSQFSKACTKALKQVELADRDTEPVAPASMFLKSGYEQIKIDIGDIVL